MDKQTLVQDLINAAAGHDWFYQYSDDYRHWTVADRQWSRMNAAFAALYKVDRLLARQTWDSFAPNPFRCAKEENWNWL